MLRRVLLRVFLLFLAGQPGGARAADQVLVLEQEYNIIEQGKEGVQAQDIRQKLYIAQGHDLH